MCNVLTDGGVTEGVARRAGIVAAVVVAVVGALAAALFVVRRRQRQVRAERTSKARSKDFYVNGANGKGIGKLSADSKGSITTGLLAKEGTSSLGTDGSGSLPGAAARPPFLTCVIVVARMTLLGLFQGSALRPRDLRSQNLWSQGVYDKDCVQSRFGRMWRCRRSRLRSPPRRTAVNGSWARAPLGRCDETYFPGL